MQEATKIARAMVTKYGMSAKVLLIAMFVFSTLYFLQRIQYLLVKFFLSNGFL